MAKKSWKGVLPFEVFSLVHHIGNIIDDGEEKISNKFQHSDMGGYHLPPATLYQIRNCRGQLRPTKSRNGCHFRIINIGAAIICCQKNILILPTLHLSSQKMERVRELLLDPHKKWYGYCNYFSPKDLFASSNCSTWNIANRQRIWNQEKEWLKKRPLMLLPVVCLRMQDLLHFVPFGYATVAYCLKFHEDITPLEQKRSSPYTCDLNLHRASAMLVHYFWRYEHFSVRQFDFWQ